MPFILLAELQPALSFFGLVKPRCQLHNPVPRQIRGQPVAVPVGLGGIRPLYGHILKDSGRPLLLPLMRPSASQRHQISFIRIQLLRMFRVVVT